MKVAHAETMQNMFPLSVYNELKVRVIMLKVQHSNYYPLSVEGFPTRSTPSISIPIYAVPVSSHLSQYPLLCAIISPSHQVCADMGSTSFRKSLGLIGRFLVGSICEQHQNLSYYQNHPQ